MTYFITNSITTRCEICGCMIPSCQKICLKCEWRKEEENKDNKDISDIKKNDWEVNHER